MGNKFGSVWNKWDFHVHTPYSILHNEYDFEPFELNEEEIEKHFDKYVKTLFTKAIENKIVSIGITDYFMIDGYKRIVTKYLQNPNKMKELFPDDSIRNQIKKIFVFPNIELRLNTFVGRNSHSINYHVIFSNIIPIYEIENNFLQLIEFQSADNRKLPLTKDNIKIHGREIKRLNGANGNDLLVGLQNIALDYKEIINKLESNPTFAEKYIITIPVDEDLSNIEWKGRDYTTRKDLYRQCSCYMTANEHTAIWALAEGDEKERINEFGALKPCIWGSDAHSYERMFSPDENRFCWIKAEPSFEGLMQIIYEPKERVAIQSDNPNNKNIHQIIESIQFDDERFQTEPIVFNDYLTCIIGGKSTGKSLLLQQLARAIDFKYANKQEESASFHRKPLSLQNTVVKWKDGTTNNRKIVYIPQTFLNRTIDNPEKETAINNIIADVLKQEPVISEAFSDLEKNLRIIRKSTELNISEYCEKLQTLSKLIATIKENGSPESFEKTLENLEVERSALAKEKDIKDEDIVRYAELEKQIKELESKQTRYEQELKNYKHINNPVVIIPGYFSSIDNLNIQHLFEHAFPHTNKKLETAVNEMSKNLVQKWKDITNGLIADLKELSDSNMKEMKNLKNEYISLKPKIEQNEKIQKLSVQISTEQEKLKKAKENQYRADEIKNQLIDLQNNILKSQEKFLNVYNNYCKVVEDTGTGKDTDLTFKAQPVWKQEDFQNTLSDIFDNRNYSSFNNIYKYNLAALNSINYGYDLLSKIWEAMIDDCANGSLTIKSGYTLENALQQIFKDWYNIHYIVKSGNDAIDEMSPGKKALVLLELLINLEDSKCPILIDQPEDDLDNRSIYNDLVQYIKNKKKERQIIVVTHNANVVLGADAEEVIIANQDSKNSPNYSRRFEYRSGAIENDEKLTDENENVIPGILNQSGIQTQICDILEGGKSAFELRKNKYSSLTDLHE